MQRDSVKMLHCSFAGGATTAVGFEKRENGLWGLILEKGKD